MYLSLEEDISLTIYTFFLDVDVLLQVGWHDKHLYNVVPGLSSNGLAILSARQMMSSKENIL